MEIPAESLAGVQTSVKPESRVAALATSGAPQWSQADTVLICALLLADFATAFWRLGSPPEMVFDENQNVRWAQAYLQGLPWSSSHHPPLPILIISLAIRIFGDRPFSWRLPSATAGVLLVGITYLLGRRMFASRLAATLAALLLVCDGLFLVNSRTALHEIFYVTFGALSYLMLFRFARDLPPRSQARTLIGMGIGLGLCLGSKLLIPVVTEFLVLGFLEFMLVAKAQHSGSDLMHDSRNRRMLALRLYGSLALVGGLSVLVYEAAFLPNYWFGWWRGISDQLAYYASHYKQDINMGAHGNPYDSNWWSWPLMLRPVLYWPVLGRPFFDWHDSEFWSAEILALGNPVICWGVLAAIPLFALGERTRRSVAGAFIVAGYALYLAMWIPITRYKFVYHYMPALYLGFLALAAVLAECWEGKRKGWEHAVLILSLAPAALLGFGTTPGLAVAVATALSYTALRWFDPGLAGKFVCVLFVAATLIAFIYFFPIWTGLPLTPSEFKARMWLHGPGLANWM